MSGGFCNTIPCNPCEYGRPQDLPPPGGYPPIPYKRVPIKPLFSGYMMFAGYIAITSGALFLYNITYKKVKKHQIELRSHKMAIYPMLLAERDREYLKQLRRNREAEEKLMANVPGWEVGKYYGERVYNMVPEDELITPIFHDYYAHSKPSEWFKRANIKLWS